MFTDNTHPLIGLRWISFLMFNRDLTITVDCDDTYPLDQLDYFSKLIFEENYDVVDGNRLPRKPNSCLL